MPDMPAGLRSPQVQSARGSQATGRTDCICRKVMRYSKLWLHAGSYSTGAVVGAAAVAVFGTVAAQRPARTAQKADSGSSQVIVLA